MCEDPNLFGALPEFRKGLTTFEAWLALMDAAEGQPFYDSAARAIVERATGVSEMPIRRADEVLTISGVQAGKSLFAALVIVKAALLAKPGETGVIVAQGHRQSKNVLFRLVRDVIRNVPALRSFIRRETTEALELVNGAFIQTFPADPAAVRGVRGFVCVADEFAFLRDTEGSPNAREMLVVLRGRCAMTGGVVWLFTSPFSQEGAAWELFQKNHGVVDARTLTFQLPAYVLNPDLPASYVRRQKELDPFAYQRDVEGVFCSNQASPAFEGERLDLCVDSEVTDRTAQGGGPFFAFVDMASGGGKDSAAIAVAHVEYDETVVLDALRIQAPPFDPEKTIAAWGLWLRSLGVSFVVGDRFAPGLLPQSFARYGITYEPSTMTRSDLYLGARAFGELATRSPA
jgi:hypothetical protein